MAARIPELTELQTDSITADDIDKLSGVDTLRRVLNGRDAGPSTPSAYLQSSFARLQGQSKDDPLFKGEMYMTMDNDTPQVMMVKSYDITTTERSPALHTARLLIRDDSIRLVFSGNVTRDQKENVPIKPHLQPTLEYDLTWELNGTCTVVLRKKTPFDSENSEESVITIQLAPTQKLIESKTTTTTNGIPQTFTRTSEQDVHRDFMSNWNLDLEYSVDADAALTDVLREFFDGNSFPIPSYPRARQ